MINLCIRISKSVQKRGLRATFELCKNELARNIKIWRSLDRIHGTDTSGSIPLEKLDIACVNRLHGTQYQPTPTRVVERTLRSLRVRHEDYVFVDFGSGKGRVLLLASLYPFKRVIGIEFAPELHMAAIANISKFKNRKQVCFQVDSVCIDAADYEIPSEPGIFYFFNPFDEVILKKVLTNIKRSIECLPREFHFIYYNPIHAHLFEELGFPESRVHLVEVEPGTWGSI